MQDNESRLEQEVRDLKSLVRSLQKRLRKVDKGFKEEEAEEVEDFPVSEKCNECGKGTLSTVRVAGREFKRCNVCEYRSKAKKL